MCPGAGMKNRCVFSAQYDNNNQVDTYVFRYLPYVSHIRVGTCEDTNAQTR